MNNSKKIAYNLIIGILSEVLTIVLGVLVPKFILNSYGSETNGLLTSVTQIYTYIALLESGIGTATVQALYKTESKNDRAATNRIMAATNKYYHKTGLLYLLAIALFAFIYPLVIHTDIPKVTVVLVIIFAGLGSVINYFFQGKYFLLLQAEGKNYIQTSLTMFTNVFKNIAKIILMAAGLGVVFVQAIAMVVSLIQMFYITWYIKKHYGWIDLTVEPDFESISQSKNVLVHQVSGLIFNNTDTLILTVFCGLKVVSVYSMYTLLFGMISTALNTFTNSVVFVLGQTFHSDREKYIKMHDCFELYYMTLVFALYTVANYFILPFMKLYVSGVTDINYIDKYLPLMFISTYLLSCGRKSSNQVINFANHFKKTQNRSIFESIINIVVSLIAVNYLGIYGVLIGTIAALLYRTNDMIFYANHKILNRSVLVTYRRWFINLAIFIVINALSTKIHLTLNTYAQIFLWCVPYTIITLFVFFSINSLVERSQAVFLLEFAKNKFRSLNFFTGGN